MKLKFKYIFVNTLTLIRLVICFYIVYKETLLPIDMILMFGLFFTDFLDGFFARKLNATSSFGREFDQLTDKVVFYMLYYNLINLELGLYLFLFLFIFRDTILSSLRIIKYDTSWLKTNFVNKLKTAFQFLIIILSYCKYLYGIPPLNIIYIFTIITLILCYYPLLGIVKDELSKTDR